MLTNDDIELQPGLPTVFAEQHVAVHLVIMAEASLDSTLLVSANIKEVSFTSTALCLQ